MSVLTTTQRESPRQWTYGDPLRQAVASLAEHMEGDRHHVQGGMLL